MVTRSCLHCGKQFDVPYPSSKRLNCSEECRIARLRQPRRKRKADSGTRRTDWVEVECTQCGKAFELVPWQARAAQQRGGRVYCSTECSDALAKRRYSEGPQANQLPLGRKLRGEGRHINKSGYANVYVSPAERPPGRERLSYHPEHRMVMAKHLGRWLEGHETIHHINGNKADNRIENLQLRNGNHGRGSVARCRTCGSHDIEHLEV
jgi:endogenous inhibitor of DNA gyrase (YacG/DUF329 family)